ncbi:MAG: thiamine phosphate synthase, partial [Planctomycetota bacterium]
TVGAACRAGVGIVQVREKEAPDDVVAALVTRLLPEVRAAGALLLVNDRVQVAVDTGADGVHIGPDDMDPVEARERLGPDAVIGITTHTLEQARRAVKAGADYVGIGPVFPTETKGVPVLAIGPEPAGVVARTLDIPAFAIGGIDARNIHRLRAAGVTRFAVCASVLRAEDPVAAVEALLDETPPEQRSGDEFEEIEL